MRTLKYDQAAEIEAARKAGYQIIRSKLAPVTFAFKTAKSGNIWLMAWRGRGGKVAINYSFRTMARAEEVAKEFASAEATKLAYRLKREAEKKAKRANLKASDFWQVGDVVYTSWGYDQTNVEYYQIIEVKARSVKIQQIAMNSSDQPGSPTGGYAQPRRNEFIGSAYLSPINEDGRFNAGPTYGGKKPEWRNPASKWNGKAKYTSSYA